MRIRQSCLFVLDSRRLPPFFSLGRDHLHPQLDMSQCTHIFNGARCKAYSWSQSHGDLEIRIKVDKSINYENIQVDVSKTDICVEVLRESVAGYDSVQPSEIMIEGKFEHPVDTESVYWLIEDEKLQNYIVIYVDKAEEMWWKRLLIGEETIERGSRYYTVAMDQLDDSSRMAIDRLVNEQQQKRLKGSTEMTNNDFDSPV